MTFFDLRRRLPLALLCAPLLMLAGCPQDGASGTAGSSAKTSGKATAPPIAPTPAQTQAAAQAAAAAEAAQKAQAAAQAAAEQQRAQQIRQLIANAETSYNSGLQNYRSNRLDAARLDFDFAVDAMLTSGMDLKSEGPLADEFDRLLNAINALELVALKQGNGLSPKVEEAPLEVAENLTFAPNPELVAELKTELNTASDLPLVINDQVAGYIGAFSGSENFRKHMAASLQRVGKYRGLIQSVLKEEGGAAGFDLSCGG